MALGESRTLYQSNFNAMKKFTLKTLLVASVLMFSAKLNAQFYFGVQPGNLINGANFGYQFKKWVPYAGLQWIKTSATMTETGKRWDNDLMETVDYSDKLKYNLSLLIPTIGTKYFLVENNNLKAYLNVNLSKALISGKVEDSNDPTANDDFQNAIKKTSASGMQIGFGTEYFFEKQFSIGGEFGCRLMNMKSEDSHDETFFDSNTNSSVTTTITNVSKAGLSPTYGRLTLNFYFVK